MYRDIAGRTFGEKLIYLRGSRTQQEVADALGIPVGRYGNYERNRNQPPIEILVKMAEYFNVTLDWLLAGKGRGPEDGDQKSSTDESIRNEGFKEGVSACKQEEKKRLAASGRSDSSDNQNEPIDNLSKGISILSNQIKSMDEENTHIKRLIKTVYRIGNIFNDVIKLICDRTEIKTNVEQLDVMVNEMYTNLGQLKTNLDEMNQETMPKKAE